MEMIRLDVNPQVPLIQPIPEQTIVIAQVGNHQYLQHLEAASLRIADNLEGNIDGLLINEIIDLANQRGQVFNAPVGLAMIEVENTLEEKMRISIAISNIARHSAY